MKPSALLGRMPVASAQPSGLRYLFMPQPSARTRRLTQEERTDLSGRRMIECAVELIVERGVTGTKLTDVGLRAGYSRGLAAMRFGTKAALLGHVVRHVTSNWIVHLRMAVGEMLGFKTTPFPIVINEALEISRRYSAPESINFLNGMLDAIARSVLPK